MKAYMKPAFNLVPLSANDLVPGSCLTEEDMVDNFELFFDIILDPSVHFAASQSCAAPIDNLLNTIRTSCKFESESLLFLS